MPTSTIRVPLSRFLPLCWLAVTALFVTGCGNQEQIESYTVATHESIQTPQHRRFLARRKYRPERSLAAIVPHGKLVWFFKIQGAPADVESSAAGFRKLVKSLRFSGEHPVWTLPFGWRTLPGNEMRYKTLVTSGRPPMGVSVSYLAAGDDLAEGIRDNINRWRGQIGLPPIQTADISAYTETIPLGKIEATLMDATGKTRPDPDEVQEITYDAPAEWTRMAPKPFTIAVFEAVDDGKKVTISLSRAGGSKLDNVNRWRGQLGLEPLDADEVDKQLQKITIEDRTGELIELKTEGRTMLGLMVPDGDQTVFVKLDGAPELAVRERDRFEQFAKSLQF